MESRNKMEGLNPIFYRNFGLLKLPVITVGTMRWAEKNLNSVQVLDLMRYCFSSGLNTYHISKEYSSFPFFKNSFLKFTQQERSRFNIVAKVACPDFRDTNFLSSHFKERIYRLLDDLSIDKLSIVQWMDRWDQLNPERDKMRIIRLKEFNSSLLNCTNDLIKEGVVDEFSSFPYSVNYADNLLNTESINKFTCYFNSSERDYEHLIDTSQGFIAIRPFKAKELLNNKSDKTEAIAKSLEFVLSKNISSTIVGINNTNQVDEIIQILDGLEVDLNN